MLTGTNEHQMFPPLSSDFLAKSCCIGYVRTANNVPTTKRPDSDVFSSVANRQCKSDGREPAPTQGH